MKLLKVYFHLHCILSLGSHLQMHGTHSETEGHFYTNSWSVFLDLATPPHRRGTVFVFISLGRLFSVEGPPRGRLAAPQHSSSLHQRPPRSAILGLSTRHKRTAAQRVRGEGRDGRWRRLREIVSKSGIRGGENEWSKGGACVYVCAWLCACMCVCTSLCPCMPAHVFLCVQCVFLHISQLCQQH